MNSAEPWTIKRLLQWTTDYLKQHGADSPRLDAEVLLASARQCQRIELYTCFDETLSDPDRDRFRQLVRQRAQGTPVAYLVGHREFYSLTFEVTPDVLIPRPETELLIIEVLDRLSTRSATDDAIRMVDVGTGSGNIAVTLAKNIESCHMVAIDMSAAALEVARRNASRHDVSDKIQFLQGDLLAPIASEPPFDFVVSNPPYISESELERVASDVRDHEPHLALVAGPHGWEIVQRLVTDAIEVLNQGGYLLMEISPYLGDTCREIVERTGAYDQVEVKKDLSGLSRLVVARRC